MNTTTPILCIWYLTVWMYYCIYKQKHFEVWPSNQISPVCLRPCICRCESLKYLLLQPGWAHTNGRFSLASDFTTAEAIPGTRLTSFEKETSETTEDLLVEMFTLCVNLLYVYMHRTDLKSSEDTMCVYVVLGTHKHGWRGGYGFSVVVGCMATARKENNEQNENNEFTNTEKFWCRTNSF